MWCAARPGRRGSIPSWCVTAATADDTERDELARLNGTWKALTVVQDGKDLPKPEAEAMVLTIAGESVTRPAVVAQRLGPDSVGQQVELQLIRAGNLLSLQARVGIRPSK